MLRFPPYRDRETVAEGDLREFTAEEKSVRMKVREIDWRKKRQILQKSNSIT